MIKQLLTDKLLEILYRERINQTQLATKLNVSTMYLNHVINGKRSPGVKFLIGLDQHYHKVYREVWEALKQSAKVKEEK